VERAFCRRTAALGSYTAYYALVPVNGSRYVCSDRRFRSSGIAAKITSSGALGLPFPLTRAAGMRLTARWRLEQREGERERVREGERWREGER
jgi:hypothetical protein